MALATTPREASPYDPPRARWWSPLLYQTDALRRHVPLESLPKFGFYAAPAAGFLVPGLAVYLSGQRVLGRVALFLYGVLLLIFVIWIGRAAGNLAFGLMLSLHATGFVYYLTPRLRESLARRLAATVLTLLALSAFIYLPARYLIEHAGFVPLQVKGEIIVTHPVYSIQSIRPGDWIAYDIPASFAGGEGAVNVESGTGLGRVLAGPGDLVKFSVASFSVNGVLHPRLAYMPRSGVRVMLPNQWFVWPSLTMHGHGNVAEARISSTLLHMALVTKPQLIGKPFRRWFWWRQIAS
jgi:hypothetical protein